MGKSSRQKRRTYQTPKRSRNGANLVWYAAAAVLVIGGIFGVAISRSHSATAVAPQPPDHWHISLGVNDCGTWVPDWLWPPGNVTGSNAVGTGAPAQAGSGGLLYAPLHSHGDGLIHVEPITSTDGGNNATLGAYFKYGGWSLNQTSIHFVNVNEKNGNTCNGKPGVLRWAVNGKEHVGNPAKYKVAQADAIELVFTTAAAKLPPLTQIPSYPALQSILGITPTSTSPAGTVPPTSGPATTAPKSTAPTGSTSTPPTTAGTTSTSKP
jgi:hypothetical protein